MGELRFRPRRRWIPAELLRDNYAGASGSCCCHGWRLAIGVAAAFLLRPVYFQHGGLRAARPRASHAGDRSAASQADRTSNSGPTSCAKQVPTTCFLQRRAATGVKEDARRAWARLKSARSIPASRGTSRSSPFLVDQLHEHLDRAPESRQLFRGAGRGLRRRARAQVLQGQSQTSSSRRQGAPAFEADAGAAGVQRRAAAELIQRALQEAEMKLGGAPPY